MWSFNNQLSFEQICTSTVCNYTFKTFHKWSMGDNPQYFEDKNVGRYLWSLLNNQPWPSLPWGKCLLANKPILNMKRTLWKKVKIRKRMDQFGDTTGNNVCTLNHHHHHHHHQNWAYNCHTYWRKKDNIGKKNSKSLKSNVFHMEHKLITNVVSIELRNILY